MIGTMYGHEQYPETIKSAFRFSRSSVRVVRVGRVLRHDIPVLSYKGKWDICVAHHAALMG